MKKSKKQNFKKRISISLLKKSKPSAANLSAKSKNPSFKKRKSLSLKILKPSTNLSANEVFSILDSPDYKQLRSGIKYKKKEEWYIMYMINL